MATKENTFWLCRNSRPLADWLVESDGQNAYLTSFTQVGKTVKIHETMRLRSGKPYPGFVRVDAGEVQNVIHEMERRGKRAARAKALV